MLGSQEYFNDETSKMSLVRTTIVSYFDVPTSSELASIVRNGNILSADVSRKSIYAKTRRKRTN